MTSSSHWRCYGSRIAERIVLVAPTAIVVAGARHYAGCWGDRNRLATVDCLVDYDTLAKVIKIVGLRPEPRQPGPDDAGWSCVCARSTGRPEAARSDEPRILARCCPALLGPAVLPERGARDVKERLRHARRSRRLPSA